MNKVNNKKWIKNKAIKSIYYKPMTKEVTLSISERVAAGKILNGFKGDLTLLAVIIDDMKQIGITPEEWEKAELVKTPIMDAEGKASGQESWNWQDKEELKKTMTLNSDTILFIQNEIKAKEEKKEVTLADIPLITLKTNLQ